MNKRIIVILGIALAMVGLGYYFKDSINLETLHIQREHMQNFVRSHYLVSLLGFMMGYALVVISSFPFSALVNVLGGFLFGTTLGAVLSIIGGTAGAIVSFLMFRYLLGKKLQDQYKHRFASLNNNINRYGARYLLIIHFLVGVPFFVINVLAALTKISLSTFIWTTAVGILPSSFLYAYAGSKLGTIQSIKEIFSWPIVIIFVVLVSVGLGSVMLDKYRERKTLSR